MTSVTLLVLLLSVALAATAQLLLKRGMTLASAQASAGRRPVLLEAVVSPWVLGGLAVFGCSAVAWLLTLARVPLSVAYPFNAVSYLIVLTVSVVVLKEHTNVWTWLGTVMVIGGLLVVVTLAPKP